MARFIGFLFLILAIWAPRGSIAQETDPFPIFLSHKVANALVEWQTEKPLINDWGIGLEIDWNKLGLQPICWNRKTVDKNLRIIDEVTDLLQTVDEVLSGLNQNDQLSSRKRLSKIHVTKRNSISAFIRKHLRKEKDIYCRFNREEKHLTVRLHEFAPGVVANLLDADEIYDELASQLARQ